MKLNFTIHGGPHDGADGYLDDFDVPEEKLLAQLQAGGMTMHMDGWKYRLTDFDPITLHVKMLY